MPHLNLKFVFTISLLYLLLPILAWLGLTTLALRRIPDSAQTKNDRLIPIYNSQPFVQEVSPQNNGLSTIFIYLKNARLQNDDPFNFTLSDSAGMTLRQIKLSGRNIGDGDNIRFQFDRLLGSAGKNYTISLEAPYTNFDAPKIEAGVSAGEPGLLAYELFYRPTNRFAVLASSSRHIITRALTVRFLSLLSLSTIVSYHLLKRLLLKGVTLQTPPAGRRVDTSGNSRSGQR